MKRSNESIDLKKIILLLNQLKEQISVVEELQRISLISDLFDETEMGLLDWIRLGNTPDFPLKMQMMVQYENEERNANEIVTSVIKKYNTLHPNEILLKLEIYVKPEEKKIYFVANDNESKDYWVPLYFDRNN